MIKKGEQIELLNGKTITVANVRESEYGIIVTSTDGDIYTEDELNLRYSISPEFILYNILYKYDIESSPYKHDIYKAVLEEFMREMEKSGYVRAAEE